MFLYFSKIVLQYLNKGSRVYCIKDQLQTHGWQGKNGQERYIMGIVLPPYKGELKLLCRENDDDFCQEKALLYDKSSICSMD
ncbi:single-stranded DNA-binding protein [Bartonella capreoli]|uniref:single-stranded DNA-binding protein n=1 Tax=Bartonella capreoli TaxID=155192 RepID=UPI0024835E06|nr:single-stranded DNA-binding protein [Bartonella capreoli]